MRTVQAFFFASAVNILLVGFTVEHSLAGRTEYLCGDGYYHYNCNEYKGWNCQDGKVKQNPADCKDHGGTAKQIIPVCGDGVVDVEEQCDNGAANSDLQPNACRPDCRLAGCGDGVVDAGEECDDGSNTNQPNDCRPGCKLPVCGDGILDDGSYGSAVFNEECDDGNSIENDGCRSDCKACLRLAENIEITTDTRLCGDIFHVPDYGDEGVIIVKHPGVTIDCDGATLQGSGIGTGIFVKMSNDVKIRNCTIRGYGSGVKAVSSQGLLIASGNDFSGSTKAVELENSTRVYENLKPEVPGGIHSAGGAGLLDQAGPAGDGSKGRAQTSLKTMATQGVMAGRGKGTPTGPVINYPRSAQRFKAPANFVARLEGKNREKLIYRIKNRRTNKIEQQSYSGRFNNVPAGDYCIEAAFVKTPDSPGNCVGFTVEGLPVQQVPTRVPVQRPVLKPMKPLSPNIR